MITSRKIDKCMYLGTRELEQALRLKNPRDRYRISDSRFIGITNSRKFCYEIMRFDTDLGEMVNTKIFVDLDNNDRPYADY